MKKNLSRHITDSNNITFCKQMDCSGVDSSIKYLAFYYLFEKRENHIFIKHDIFDCFLNAMPYSMPVGFIDYYCV